jgi:DeoR/GlpR family transcriptional regulator of sugar metabolism
VAQEGDAQVKQAMLRASRRSILVVDRTKLDRHEPFAVAPLAAFDLVITDQPIAMALGEGPEVRVVGAG